MNTHSLLVQAGLALVTAPVAFLATGIVEWYLHAIILHRAGSPGHEEHHELHAKLDFKSVHEGEEYGVAMSFVIGVTLALKSH
jgi:hypothetical protein